MILLGYGNLGRAIAGCEGFRRRNFQLLAAFDTNPAVHRPSEYGFNVYDTNEIPQFLDNNPVKIGIITTTGRNCPKMVDLLVAHGVEGDGICPVRSLHPPVLCGTSHLVNSLMTPRSG